MVVGMVDYVQQLLQQIAVWFFGLFGRLADYFETRPSAVRTSYKNVVVIITRQHWDEAFREADREGKVGILAYFTKWSSPPCKFLRPWFSELSELYTTVKFVTVYVEDLEDLAVEAGVKFIPEFHFYHGGVVDKVQGAKRNQVEVLLHRKVEKPATQVIGSKQTQSKKAV